MEKQYGVLPEFMASRVVKRDRENLGSIRGLSGEKYSVKRVGIDWHDNEVALFNEDDSRDEADVN